MTGILTNKEVYYTNLDVAAKKTPMHKSMRLNWVNTMILRVESAKAILENNGNLPLRAREALQQYEVLEVTSPSGNTEKKLFTKPSPGVLWEVVPLSKTYPVMTEAHLGTGHGNVAAMKTWLINENLCVAPSCLQIIIDVCPVCQVDQNRSEDSTPDIKNTVQHVHEIVEVNEPVNNVGSQETMLASNLEKLAQISDSESNLQFPQPIPVETKFLISKPLSDIPNAGLFVMKVMESLKPDNKSKLKDLLIYQDMNTGFLQLRPVSGWDVVETISSELMNIFTDIGLPSTIIVHSSMESLMQNTLERLNEIFSSNIELVTTEIPPAVVDEVSLALKEWVSKKNLQGQWFLGCYHVQWTLNNTPGYDGTSAFEKMFSKKRYPNKELDSRKPTVVYKKFFMKTTKP